jgi:predicted phage tail protein
MALVLSPQSSAETDRTPASEALLKIVCSPLRGPDGKLRVRTLPLRAGTVLAEALPTGATWDRLICNGAVLDAAAWPSYALRPGDEILAIPRWGLGPEFIPFLILAGIGLAVSLATTALTYLLFPPAKPHVQQAVEEPTFSFEGIRTAVGPGNVTPVIYGRHRVGGQLLSAAVDQVYTVLDGQSAGPPVSHAIDNVFGGDAGHPIVVVANNHGATDGAHVDIGGVTGKDSANGGWYVRVLDIHTVELQSSAGVDARPYTGGGVLVVVALGTGIRRIEAQTAPPTLSLLLAVGEGPIGGVDHASIEINGQPIGNFPTVQVFERLGTSTQTPIAEFGETSNTFADGREIIGDPGIVYTTSAACEAFVLNIAFQQGLFVLSPRGEKEENVSTFGYRYRVSPSGAWSEFSFWDVAASRTSVVRFGIRKEALALAIYDIHLQWSHAHNVNDVQAKWQPSLESITEIRHNTNAYPNTALLGLRAVATDALQGSLPNVTFIVRGRTVRVNTFAAVETWTDNPAWCTMDLLTHPRYGLGHDDALMDLPAFAAWAAYCDEALEGFPRHTLNYVLDREMREQPALLEIAGGSRALLLKSEGLWTPRVTRDEIPVQLFSWANVTNLTLTYTRDPDQINVMEGRFANEDEDFAQDVLTWPTVEHWPAEVRKASLDLRGITMPRRVMRALQFELNRRRFETLSLTMDCAADALVLQVHDLFRFSHPLPGWGTAGRVMPGSTTTTLVLDEPVTVDTTDASHAYVRHEDGTVELCPVVHPGVGTFHTLTLATALGQSPAAYTSLWAFGRTTPETAIKVFRVTRLARNSDTTVRVEAIAHNPSIYDEPTAVPLPNITTLFNPLGPPPPVTSLVLTEVTRVQASGASLRVVNLSWDIAPLSRGFGPYGGAAILRRTVLDSSLGGMGDMGAVDLGAVQGGADSQVGFVPVAQLRGHILDFDDYTVLTGTTYIYRVIPVSQRGVPNNTGARDGLIHVAGPTTPDYFPGTVRNLRLKDQAVGATFFEGRDVHLQWEPVANSPLFTQTFFVQDYIVEVWAPAQEYLLRHVVVLPIGVGETINWTYTFEQNIEDQQRAGQAAARRDMIFYVWARTNTNRISLDPAVLGVTNPPPDMSMIIPDVTPLVAAARVQWDQYAEPRDFDHYEVHLDTINPPMATYADIAVHFSGQGTSVRDISPQGLTIGTTYYVYILPYDTFGVGVPSQIASFVPFAVDLTFLDNVPPAVPTGLTMSTGTAISDDGTIVPWVQANWAMGTEADLAGYEVQFRVTPNPNPSVFQVGRVSHARLENVPGNVTITCRIAAFDKLHNISLFTADASITTGSDTVPPAAPTNLIAVGGVQRINLLWTPPPDADYESSEVWSATVNNRVFGNIVGRGSWSFLHANLGPTETRYYWLRARDTSGNLSAAFFPPSDTTGVVGQAGQLDTTYISSLAADKIIAGTITALVSLGVNNIHLDGVNSLISIVDQANTPRIYMGKLGPLATQWGIQVFNSLGQLMWNFQDGAQTPGIADEAITTAKIRAGTITAELLVTDVAVITNTAQIANALIVTAHITNAAITAALIGDAQVQSAHIADAAIQTAHIVDAAITDAKVVTLTANKVTTGTLSAVYTIGVASSLVLDGVNRQITVRDDASTARVLIGKLGAGGGDYGLEIFDSAGTVMWDFSSGASTRGIAPNAVSTSVVYATGSGITSSTGAEVSVGTITFPAVSSGDTVLLFVTCIGITVLAGPGTLTLRLRASSLAGAIINSTAETAPGPATSMALNGLQAITVGTTSMVYHVTVQLSAGTGTVGVSDLTMIGLRMQR